MREIRASTRKAEIKIPRIQELGYEFYLFIVAHGI